MVISYGEIAQLITAVAVILGACLSIRNGRKIQEVHISLNSRLSELLKVTAEAAHTNGIETERERVRQEALKTLTVLKP